MSKLELNKILFLKYNECEQERLLLDNSITNLNKSIKIQKDSIIILNKIISNLKENLENYDTINLLLIIIFIIVMIFFIFLASKELYNLNKKSDITNIEIQLSAKKKQ